jgi:hypothetical protein
MVAGKPDDYKSVIHANKHKSLAVILAANPACIQGWEKFAVRGRRYEIHDVLGPKGFVPPSRCVVVIFVCPGQDISPAVSWCKKSGIRPLRVRFVLHPECDEVKTFRSWYLAYDTDPIVQYADSYPGLQGAQKALGEWYNDWIYLDATGQDWPVQR